MIQISRSALVLAPTSLLYSLINDIEHYPEFLDGVVKGEVLSQSDTEMVGALTLRKAGIERKVVTRNQLVANERITLTLEEGPLQSLTGVWTLSPLGDQGCKVALDLRFDMGSGLKAKAFGAIFKQVADSMVDAFVQRAQALHSS